MHCKELIEGLNGYLDGEAAPLVRAEVEEHIHACPGCRCLVDTCRQTIRVYRTHPVPELPAALHRRVMDRVRREKSGNR